jgi:hypothetical protein
MNTPRRLALPFVALLAAAALFAGCSSDDATTAKDDVSNAADDIGDSVSDATGNTWSDVTATADDFGRGVTDLPQETQNEWARLRTDWDALVQEFNNTDDPTEQARTAWENFKVDAKAFDESLPKGADELKDDTRTAWEDFKEGLDRIDADIKNL